MVGYGWCGRGIALRARGMGAQVIVAEVEPLRALEAAMDGFRVMPLLEAMPLSDLVVTATGDKHVVARSHLERARDGCVHGQQPATSTWRSTSTPCWRWRWTGSRVRELVDEYRCADGRRVYGSWPRDGWSTWPPPRAIHRR
ncbi:MAG: hypothetical protein KatS3mg124_1953 [Porticoccaceae bacterium]|nr:MAG: hypothetical protein KatS3mg124_1953 [Porticoccaceae bacterium]